MMDAFAWIEQTAFSRWVREDDWAYFELLILHAWAMAFLVGGGMAVSLRVLGVASGARLERFAGFFPFMRWGAVLAIVSGLGLLAGYPAKALTNWVFGLKLACFMLAGLIVWRLARIVFPLAARDEPLPGWAKWLAAIALFLWFAGVACGKLLLHTNKMLLVS
jgi:hypothetical protein